jgi:Cytochrome c554 and c-prime
MRCLTFRLVLGVAVLLPGAWGGLVAQPKAPVQPPVGPFGLSRITTTDGKPVDISLFLQNETCSVCHEREFKELQGSMHSVAHTEGLYRSFAELGRKEAGNETYRHCAGCHSAAGVVSGLIPAKHDSELPFEAKEGVACDVCHQIKELTGTKGPWGEPGNASFVIEAGRTKFGDSGVVAENRLHTGEKREFFKSAELCASCHTVIHPTNGLRIETTYDEWKSSVYAKQGIQCQDCHMRSVEDAIKVAQTLRPVVVKGQRAVEGAQREIHPHFFVGGNANADLVGGGVEHAKMAEARLKSAAQIDLKAPAKAMAGKEMALDVVVHNVAAGHNLPTGVTELRRIWVDLQVVDHKGKQVFRVGELDERGDLRPDAIWFGAVAVDRAGKPTIRPWEMVKLARKQAIPPKDSVRATIKTTLPPVLSGPITVEARLLYQSAPQSVVNEVMGKKAFTPRIVEMSRARAIVSLE